MKTNLTPIALAISSVFLMAGSAIGQSFTNGSNGGNTFEKGTPFDLTNRTSYGLSGDSSGTQANADGENAQPVSGQPLLVIKDVEVSGSEGLEGIRGSNKGAGGAGGHGGGSVWGGMSVGGNGGYSASGSPSIPSSAAGGSAGDAIGNTVEISGSSFTGAAGGSGVEVVYGGSGGAGGHGGGSVWGGMSVGGNGGEGATNSSSASTSVAGGSAGDAGDNTVKISGSSFTGAAGGSGGEEGSGGAGGAGGHGGGSVWGGMSVGGNGGDSGSNSISTSTNADGGSAEDAGGNIVKILDSSFTGAAGGSHGERVNNYFVGSGSAGGHGGGSVWGGMSVGGNGGYSNSYSANAGESHRASASAAGGSAGDAGDNTVEISDSSFTGAAGGSGSAAVYGSAGASGHGGGSVWGGMSVGGNGGDNYSVRASNSAAGGSAGDAGGNTVEISNSSFTGAAGGSGVEVVYGGSGGAGGHGGGSVWGGMSVGGNGGKGGLFASGSGSSSGGSAGDAGDNTVKISGSSFTGAAGGSGNELVYANDPGGSGGAGGHGGASVWGGMSVGGNGGYNSSTSAEEYRSASADGGGSGNASSNIVMLHSVKLYGGDKGRGGTNAIGSQGRDGLGGGSVFGGASFGGAGGYASIWSFNPDTDTISANGGRAGDVSDNAISISGETSISGDVYGGYSQGGAAGVIEIDGVQSAGQMGQGGFAQNNTISLFGTGVQIAGSIYGGYSVNGDGSLNPNKSFSGNTLNLEAFRGSVKGIYNVEHYNWDLPEDVVNNDTIIQITGGDMVNLDNTKHTVTISSEGNHLKKGEQVTLIDKAVGEPYYVNDDMLPGQQGLPIQVGIGHLLLQNARLDVMEDSALLTMVDDAIINPRAKAYLEKRVASIAINNQAADMMADYSMDQSACKTALFAVADGGDSRYKTHSHIDLRDFKIALGASRCFDLPSTSTAMVGGFFEYGQANFDSYSEFDDYPDVHGWGKLHYSGIGALFHMNVAGTSKSQASKPLLDSKDGLYLNAVLRGGKGKSDFETDDLNDAQGVSGSYDSKAKYYSAMAGLGYAINFSDKHALDVYGRYTWSKVSSDSVWIDDERLDFDSTKSTRLRLGARYLFAATPQVTPYVGLAYEREFSGKATGSTTYRGQKFDVDSISVKGNTGVVELGMTVNPVAHKDALTLNMGVKGYFGERRGASAGVNLRYAF